MSDSQLKAFGTWREKVWPIRAFELKKFLPLILMKFLISINYVILFCLKDTMVVTTKGAGAEVIPILKGWVILPVAIVASLSYSKLTNYMRKTTLFYSIMTLFVLVIFLYGFCLAPYADFFAPHASSDWLIEKLGTRFEHWVSIYRNWMHTLLFVTAELWSTMVIFLMFWGFANDITSVEEAKRSYTIYISAGNIAPILAGPFIYFVTRKLSKIDFIYTIQTLSACLVVITAIIMGLYWWTNRYVLTDRRFYDPAVMGCRQKKMKLSLRDSLKNILKSKYLLLIAILVIGNALVINLIEVTWKAKLKLLYPIPSDFQTFESTMCFMIGVSSFIASFFVCGGLIRNLGWHFTAQIAPAVIGSTGIIFFILVLQENALAPYIQSFLGVSPLFFIVLFGAFQSVAAKMVKYSFFDPTKEMAYIPLSNEAKSKGKASIDVVGSRLGKSGSAWVQVALFDLVGTGSVLSITHYLLPIVAVALVGWALSIKLLNRRFQEKSQTPSTETTTA